MCLSFGGSGKSARLQMMYQAQQDQQQQQIEMARQAQEAQRQAALQAQTDAERVAREQAQGQALELQRQQLSFNQQQADYQAERDAKVQELMSRPAPPSPASAGEFRVSGDGSNSSEDEALNSRRLGRRALRIDLNGPQTAGPTGLNIPRG
jgi:multidrug efflux pump subunit AcrA (membrane-fusion protein)